MRNDMLPSVSKAVSTSLFYLSYSLTLSVTLYDCPSIEISCRRWIAPGVVGFLGDIEMRSASTILFSTELQGSDCVQMSSLRVEDNSRWRFVKATYCLTRDKHSS